MDDHATTFSQSLKEGFLPERQGHRVYWSEHGNPSGKPLLLVHGGSGYIFDLEKMTALHGTDRRVIVIHQRGVGRSEPHGRHQDNTIKDNVEDIERLRHHLQVPAMDIFAWSFGATLAAAYALQNPTRTLSLTAYAPFLGCDEDYDLFLQRWPDQAHPYFAFHNANDARSIVTSIFNKASSPIFMEQFENVYITQTIYDPATDKAKLVQSKSPEEWEQVFKIKRIGARLELELYSTQNRMLEKIAEANPLPTDCCVTFLYGGSDRWIAPTSYAKRVFPGHASTLIKDADHDVMGLAVQTALRTFFTGRTKVPAPSCLKIDLV